MPDASMREDGPVSKRTWLLVGGALLLGTALLVPVAAAGDPGPGEHREVHVSVSPHKINVPCAPGSTTGTASIQVTVRGNAPSGAMLRVTWTGLGTTILVQTVDPTTGGTLTSSAVPCPPEHGRRGGTVSFQWVAGGARNPEPAHVQYRLVALSS